MRISRLKIKGRFRNSQRTRRSVDEKQPKRMLEDYEGGIMMAGTKVSEGEEGGAPGAIVETALQPMVKTVVRQAVTLQPMELNGGADIHLQPMEDPMLEQVDAPDSDCDPMGSLCWSRLLAGHVAP
ncbi:hypothetical protein llap_4002 [Limosa lapponica baueri]|uniref:Protein pxr1-like n=1 Tax=Limosa lapponica baueri TaxID=1758121 RepID=A0A2I0UI48_LIMLA|nr:hypothetical protein llap_4002 [Limosa lapponica baueri]